jgi:hypothetical protein
MEGGAKGASRAIFSAPQRWFVLQIDRYNSLLGAFVVAETRATDYCYWKITQSS